MKRKFPVSKESRRANCLLPWLYMPLPNHSEGDGKRDDDGNGTSSDAPSESDALIPQEPIADDPNDASPPQHRSKWRFVVLFIFGTYSMVNAMQWLTYSPVQTQSKYYFNLSTSELNNLSTVYMWIYMSLAIFSCVGLERIGLRWCLLLGTGLNFLGALLKVVLGFPADNFMKCFIAQILNSLSQIFVLSIPPTLASVWFPENERGTATAVGSVFNAMGSAIGMLIPPLIVHEVAMDYNNGGNVTDAPINASSAITAAAAAVFEKGVMRSGGGAEAINTIGNTIGDSLSSLLAMGGDLAAATTDDEAYAETGRRFLRLFLLQLGMSAFAFLGVIFFVPYEGKQPTTTRDDSVGEAVGNADGPNAAGAARSAAIEPQSPPHLPQACASAEGGGSDESMATTREGGERVGVGGGGGGGGGGREEVSGGLKCAAGGAVAAGDSFENDNTSYTAAVLDERRELLDPNGSNSGTAGHGIAHQEKKKGTDGPHTRRRNPMTSVVIAILDLLKDRDVSLLLAALCISVGSVWTINSFLSQLLSTVNISEEAAGQMGFWNIVLGTVAAILSGSLIIDKFRVYKWPLVGLALLQLALLGLIIMVVYLDRTEIGDAVNPTTFRVMYILVVLNGIPQNVITPIGFEFLMELSYGHLDSLSGGLLMAIANIISFILVSVGSVLLGNDAIPPKDDTLHCLWMIFAMCAVGCCLMILPRNRLRRYEAQRAARLASIAGIGGGGAAAVAVRVAGDVDDDDGGDGEGVQRNHGRAYNVVGDNDGASSINSGIIRVGALHDYGYQSNLHNNNGTQRRSGATTATQTNQTNASVRSVGGGPSEGLVSQQGFPQPPLSSSSARATASAIDDESGPCLPPSAPSVHYSTYSSPTASKYPSGRAVGVGDGLPQSKGSVAAAGGVYSSERSVQ